MDRIRVLVFVIGLFLPLLAWEPTDAAEAKPVWQAEWEKTLAAAKMEGKVVVAVPASAELRKALENGLQATLRYRHRDEFGPRAAEREQDRHGI